MAWISVSWWYILSTPSAVGGGEAFGGLATAALGWPSSQLAGERLPWPELEWRHNSSSGSFPSRARAHATMAQVVGPRWPLARLLAHSTVALPPARRRVAERALALISPPDGRTITRKGGWCPAMASPITVESSP
jgi:hypothetical protein